MKNGKFAGCHVCGLVFADMPKACKYCSIHRTEVNAATAQLKKAAKVSNDNTELKDFERLLGLPTVDVEVQIVTVMKNHVEPHLGCVGISLIG